MSSRRSRSNQPTSHDTLLAAVVGGAQFIQMLDSTIMVSALPTMARSLNQTPVAVSLAITAYLISSAIFLPIGTWIADRFGARTVFRAAIGCFAVASMFCAAANSLAELVAARTLQGAAAAMMLPVGRLILLKSVPKNRLVAVLAVQAMPALLGPVFGFLIGGFIVTYWSWRLIFLINLPVALLGIVLVSLYVPNIREKDPSPFDRTGFLLSAVGLSALTLALDTLARRQLPWPIALLLFVGGAGLIWALVNHTRRSSKPIIDLSLLRLPTFRSAMTGGLLTRVQNGAAPFLLVLLLQSGFGLTPLTVGLIICTSSIGALTMRTIAPPLLRRFGFRQVLLANTLLTAGVLFSYTFFSAHTPLTWIVFVVLLGGVFRSLQFTSLNGLAYADVSPSRYSQATALVATLQQLAQALGVGMSAFALQESASLAGRVEVTTSDIGVALIILSVITASAIFFFILLKRDAGAAMTGHQPVRTPLQDIEDPL